MASRNIVNGVTQDTFGPDDNVTRAAFIKMLVNSIDNLDLSSTQKVSFTDVADDGWYTGFVNWASQNGVTTGYPDGTFGVDKSITRQEMAVIINRFAKKLDMTLPTLNAKATFSDESSIADYAKDSVYALQQAGIIGGKQDNMFDPNGNATRAEAAKMISNLIKILVKQG